MKAHLNTLCDLGHLKQLVYAASTNRILLIPKFDITWGLSSKQKWNLKFLKVLDFEDVLMNNILNVDYYQCSD